MPTHSLTIWFTGGDKCSDERAAPRRGLAAEAFLSEPPAIRAGLVEEA
jgi:hypothetical protein